MRDNYLVRWTLDNQPDNFDIDQEKAHGHGIAAPHDKSDKMRTAKLILAAILGLILAAYCIALMHDGWLQRRYNPQVVSQADQPISKRQGL